MRLLGRMVVCHKATPGIVGAKFRCCHCMPANYDADCIGDYSIHFYVSSHRPVERRGHPSCRVPGGWKLKGRQCCECATESCKHLHALLMSLFSRLGLAKRYSQGTIVSKQSSLSLSDHTPTASGKSDFAKVLITEFTKSKQGSFRKVCIGLHVVCCFPSIPS